MKKLNEKKINAKYGVFPNEVCLNERLILNFIIIYKPAKSLNGLRYTQPPELEHLLRDIEFKI